MGIYNTNKQFTTYRILDATIVNADVATAAAIATTKLAGGWIDSAQTLFVDVNQTTSAESGYRGDPYKTIQAAVTAVFGYEDNSADKAYVIMVAPGTYAETVSLNNAYLVNLAFIAMGGPGSVVMTGASNSLQSSTANANLRTLYVKGFRFDTPISLVGADNDTTFLDGDCTFEDCTSAKQDGTAIAVTNANRFHWKNGAIHVMNAIAVTNVWTAGIYGQNYRDLFPVTGAPGETALTANVGASSPYWMNDAHDGGDMMTWHYTDCFCQRKEVAMTCTSGIVRLMLTNAYAGLASGLSVPANGHMYGYNAIFPGDVTTNADAVVKLYNTVVSGSFTNNATDKHVYQSETAV